MRSRRDALCGSIGVPDIRYIHRSSHCDSDPNSASNYHTNPLRDKYTCSYGDCNTNTDCDGDAKTAHSATANAKTATATDYTTSANCFDVRVPCQSGNLHTCGTDVHQRYRLS
jgi:hypothetical protein